MNKYNLTDEMVPNKTLQEYIEDIINPILKKEECGLSIISKEVFKSRNIKIRKLSEIGYRLLNFIIYCHLFFANCYEYIDDDNLKKYLIENMSCIEIIETDWYILKEALKDESIESIEIFMNQIFPKLSDLIKLNYFSYLEERNKFEESVEDIIKECIHNYRNYKTKYIYENYKVFGLNKHSRRVIINELAPIEEYSEEEYPMYKYFILTKYPNKDFIKIQFEKNYEIYKNKYPLISQLLFFKLNKEQLKNLLEFNEFSNSLIKHYSFNISRTMAKNNISRSEDFISENKEKFDKFIKILNELKDKLYYKENKKLNDKEFSVDDELIYFLNDDYESEGMYIAAAYQNFISWQNGFLQPIVDSIKKYGKTNFYSSNLLNKIPIQDAIEKNILSINEDYLENKIIQYSKREIIKEDGTIDYMNYNFIKYDYDLIENELGKIILTGKCLFDEDYLNFITFKYENNSKIFITFCKNYRQKELTEEEKETLDNYFKNKDKDRETFKQFFDSLLLLFFYLNKNRVDEEETLYNVLSNIPDYINFETNFIEEIRDNFNEEGNEFRVNKLINIYFYIEQLYLYEKFEELEESLDDKFKSPINDNEKLNEKIDNLENKEDLILIIKRYIYRYLIDTDNIKDIENQDLITELGKPDLWELTKIDEKNKLNDELGDFNLKIGQIISFLKLLTENDN